MIKVTVPSRRGEKPLSRSGWIDGRLDGRMTPRAVIAAGALLVLTIAGGCREQEKKIAVPGHHAAGPIAGEKSTTPYFYGLIEEYKSVLADDPHNLAAIIALGNAYFDAGLWKQAIMHYEQALQLDPANADVITDMGTCYRNMGASGRAIAEYERALKIEPVHQNALFNLGIVYGFDRKDYATAIGYWEKLLHVAPKHPRADYLQATIAQFKKAKRQKTQ